MTPRLGADAPATSAPHQIASDPRATPSRRPGPRVAEVLTGVAVGVVVAAVRWYVSHERRVFHITPDEPGQLAMARFLGGGTRWNMGDHSTWRPGYATLISPIHWFTDDPTTGFRTAIAVNALLGGVAAALTYVLARRLTDLSPRASAATALVVSLAPAALFPTAWVWAESLVTVLALATVLALVRFVDGPSLGSGLGTGALAVAAFTTHSRMLPLVASLAAVAAVLAWRRRLPWRSAIAVVAATAIATVASARYAGWVVDRVWDDPADTNTAGAVLEQLTRPGAIAVSAAGQLWYQLVCTLGVFGLGLLALGRAAVRRGGDGRPEVTDARVVLAAVLPLVALSIVFMADRWRPDQLVYGRYNDAVVAPVLVVGVAALVSATRRATLRRDGPVVLAVTAVCGTVLWVWRRDELAEGIGVRSMILGLHSYVGTASSIPVVRITVVALLLTALLLVAALASGRRVGTTAVALGLGALALLGVARTRPAVDATLNRWTTAAAVQEVQGDVLPAGVPVRYRLVPSSEDPAATWSDQRQRRMLYQFYLPQNPQIADEAPGAAAATPYVFAPLRDPELRRAGAELLWSDADASMGLYRVP